MATTVEQLNELNGTKSQKKNAEGKNSANPKQGAVGTNAAQNAVSGGLDSFTEKLSDQMIENTAIMTDIKFQQKIMRGELNARIEERLSVTFNAFNEALERNKEQLESQIAQLALEAEVESDRPLLIASTDSEDLPEVVEIPDTFPENSKKRKGFGS